MNRIDKISLLKRLKGLTGRYSDNEIIVNFGMFKLIKDKDILLSEIIISPRGVESGKIKEVNKILKELLEGSKITNDIERLLVNAIEKSITLEISNLQRELRELLGLSGEEDSENKKKPIIFDPEMGGNTS
jgi:hypothetical protein